VKSRCERAQPCKTSRLGVAVPPRSPTSRPRAKDPSTGLGSDGRAWATRCSFVGVNAGPLSNALARMFHSVCLAGHDTQTPWSTQANYGV
jgi:hypothetical protein